MKRFPFDISKRLSFRLFTSILVVVCSIGVSFYIFLLRPLSAVVEEIIHNSMHEHAIQLHSICEQKYADILRSGSGLDSPESRVKKGITIGLVEEFMITHDLHVFIFENGRRILSPANFSVDHPIDFHSLSSSGSVSQLGNTPHKFYSLKESFSPWQWDILILKDSEYFKDKINKLHRSYYVTFSILLFAALIIFYIFLRQIKAPIYEIISSLQKGEKPSYYGIGELEYLSNSLRESLEEKEQKTVELEKINQALEREIYEHGLAENNYQNLFEKMLSGFALHEIICDDGGVPIDYSFLKVNPAFETQTGLNAKELIGKSVLEVLPGTEKHWIDTYGHVALTGEPIFFQNYSEELGKYFEVTAYRPATNQFACIFQDITHRIKAAEEKAKLESQLRQAHKMEAIGTMAGGIAHDFNNILTAILGYAEIAQGDIPDYSPAKNCITEVLTAGNRAKELVRHILTFSRMSGMKQGQVQVDLSLIVKEVLNFQRSVIPSTIEIKADIEENCGHIKGDSTQLHQILMNLCTNATHAMEEKGGILKVSLHKTELSSNDLVTEPELSAGTYIQLKVSDTGIGMTPEIIDKIFDPYFTTKDIGKGSGMGLSVVRGLVHKHHDGFIKVESVPGKGSTFIVFFPSIDEEGTPEGTTDIENLPMGTEKILFIDDEEMVVGYARVMIEKLGYSVTAKTDSSEALNLFIKDPSQFDLVITDQTMPHITGAELSKKLLKIRPDLPIILCTGYSSLIDKVRSQTIGIREYAMKPVNKHVLAGLIRKVLDGDEFSS